jgi:dynein heavy chain
VLEEIMEKLPEEFNMVELLGKAEERTPYQVVALQECERMNTLTQEIRRSLRELNLGLKVSQSINHSIKVSQSQTVFFVYFFYSLPHSYFELTLL